MSQRAEAKAKSLETRGKHWLTTPYHRRSVANDVRGFSGWKRISSILNKLDRYVKERARSDDLDIADCVAVMFTGGFRISEVVHAHLTDGGEVDTGLKKENIMVAFNDKAGRKQLIFDNVYTLKKYRKSDPVLTKDGHRRYRTIERTMGNKAWRTAGVELFEPFVPRILGFTESVGRGDYLFPSLTRQRVYQIVTKVEPAFWPHRFRAERASQLVEDYGWSVDDLMRWFRWTNYETGLAYAAGDWQSASARMPSTIPRSGDLARFVERSKGVQT